MTERAQRRLAAVVSADVVGYSRLMGQDERGTLSALKAHRAELIDDTVAGHGGRIVKTTGDGMLAEFPSVVAAVNCCVAIQDGMARRNAGVAADKAIRFRVGIHLGDIIVYGGDIFGDGVNIAARLQEFGAPGGVAVSGIVHDYLDDELASGFVDLGEHELKNIRRPIRIWQRASETDPAEPRAADPAPLSPVPKPSIAVLPFQNMSGDPEQEYFADGLTEDLITAISYWRSFPVVARDSSFSYKGRVLPTDQIASELGVRDILEGSVRKANDRVRVTATLVDTESGHELWTERFDRQLDDIFALQDKITRKVAADSGYQLQQAEIARSAQRDADDISAWDLVARGLPFFYEHTCEANRRAREFFEQAVEAAPRYSDGWAYLAWVHGHDLMIECVEDRQATFLSGIEAGRRAIALDENSSLAHLGLSSVYIWSGDVESGLAEARRALELNPNDVRAGFAVGNR